MRPFMQIPFDLAESLADLGLGRYQSIVLTEIQKQVYGPARATVASLSQAEISRRYNIHRQNVSRAVASLLAMKIIVQYPNGYGMNLVTSEWTRNGEPLLSHATQVVNTSDNPTVDVIKSDDKGVIKSDDKSTNPKSACNQIRLQMSSNSMTNVIKNDDTSSIEKNLENTTRGDVVGEAIEAQKQESIQPQGQLILTGQESSSPPSVIPFATKVKSTDDWVDEINDWLDDNRFDRQVFYRKLTGWINEYSGEWAYRAIKTVMLGKEPGNPVSYVLGTLENYRKAGSPEQSEAIHEAAKLQAKPKSSRAGELPEFKRPEWMNTGGTLPPPRPNRLPSPGGSVKHG